MSWQPLREIAKVEVNQFVVVARPDGKSWSGIVQTSTKSYVILRNANNQVTLHFDLNPTASFMVLAAPTWSIRFGQPQLNL